MERGWLCLWRKIEDSSSWSRGADYRGLMITILQKANWKEGYFMGDKINPGQFATSAINLAKELGLTRQRVQRMLSNLHKDSFIVVLNVRNQYTLVSLVNWDIYQEIKKAREQPVSNYRATDEQPVSNYRAQSNKGTMKPCNNETINTPSKSDGDDSFDKFWKEYGKPIEKKKCILKWKKLPLKTKDLIFEKLPGYVQSTPDVQYRKNPSTYLNNECWNDEIAYNPTDKSPNKLQQTEWRRESWTVE